MCGWLNVPQDSLEWNREGDNFMQVKFETLFVFFRGVGIGISYLF